jgi:hypothetical protein
MALDFSNSASTGTHYTGTNGIVYIYDGVKWNGQYTSTAQAGMFVDKGYV